MIRDVLVTSLTISEEGVDCQGVRVTFRPTSLHAYVLGANILQEADGPDGA